MIATCQEQHNFSRFRYIIKKDRFEEAVLAERELQPVPLAVKVKTTRANVSSHSKKYKYLPVVQLPQPTTTTTGGTHCAPHVKNVDAESSAPGQGLYICRTYA
eukprot:gene1228-4438_t